MQEIWTEKYRPDSLSHMVGHEAITQRLQAFVSQHTVPHCLFAGPAGTGKTTAALAMAKDLYGEQWRNNFLELNASDDRGIDIVRSKIKDFARTKPLGAPFKIIFLDESDALTPDAQQALRRTMERYSESCRFILSCNFSSKIIEPIQSRCAVFRFARLSNEAIATYIERIGGYEELYIEEEAKNALITVSQGDLRKLLNVMQAVAITSDTIAAHIVYEVSASLKTEEVRSILDKALAQEFEQARKQLRSLMIDRGLDGLDVMRDLHRTIFELELSEEQKMHIVQLLGEYEFRITEGASPDIQIESFLAQLTQLSPQE